MSFKVEGIFLISAWITTAILLILFVPRSRLREAFVSFQFKQLLTWLFGLLVVEKGLIEYPYRLFFKKANKASFTFEYFVYPSFCVLFNLYFPENRGLLIKTLYYMAHVSFIAIIEVIAEKYTQIIRYKNWNWKFSFITLWLFYFISHKYYLWFFRHKYENDSSNNMYKKQNA